MLLDVKNLDISYGDNPVPTVKDVSFSLNKGEVLAIVGESAVARLRLSAPFWEYWQAAATSAGEVLSWSRKIFCSLITRAG